MAYTVRLRSGTVVMVFQRVVTHFLSGFLKFFSHSFAEQLNVISGVKAQLTEDDEIKKSSVCLQRFKWLPAFACLASALITLRVFFFSTSANRLLSKTICTSASDCSSGFHSQKIRRITTMLPAECHGSLCCEVVSGRLRFNAVAVFLFTHTRCYAP